MQQCYWGSFEAAEARYGRMNSEGIDVRVTGGPVEEQMCQRSRIYCQQAAEAMPGLDQYRVDLHDVHDVL